jgi:hypothetical protein
LEVANILNIVISLLFLICSVFLDSSRIVEISIGLKILYLVIWSYALCSLFVKFKSSKHLLPRKRVFIIHAALLTVYFLCKIITIVMIKFLSSCISETCFYIFESIKDVVLTIANTFEVITFAYVVYS